MGGGIGLEIVKISKAEMEELRQRNLRLGCGLTEAVKSDYDDDKEMNEELAIKQRYRR